MSEAAPDLHVGPDPQQANVEPASPVPAEAAAPAVDESAQASAAAETPASATEKPVEAPVVSASTDGQQTAEATQSATSATDAPVSAAETPAPSVDELAALKEQFATFGEALTQAQADLSRVTQERDTIKEHYDRVYAEWNQMHSDLDAARKENADLKALPSLDHFRQQVESLQSRLEQEVAAHDQTKQERDLLTAAQPVATLESTAFSLPDADMARIKDAVLEALAEHAVPQVAPEADAAPPASPFINRQ